MDGAGIVSDSYVYQAFGSIKARCGTSTNAYRYVGNLGYYYDVDLLSYYLRARYYDPTTGRMLSKDPLGFTAGDTNLYRYVTNRPTNLTDPEGLQFTGDLNAFRHEINEIEREQRRAVLEYWRRRFMQWYNDNKNTSWTDSLPPCPCNIFHKVVRRLRKRCRDEYFIDIVESVEIFNPDPNVWKEPSSLRVLFPSLWYGTLHPGATYDIRTIPKPEYKGSGQQCTYDASGKLITHGPGAGTADFSSPYGTGNHWADDVEMFLWAKRLDGNTFGPYVDMYLEVRPPDDKNKCDPNP